VTAAGPEAAALSRAIGLMMMALGCLILLDASGKWLGMIGVPVAASTWSRYLGHLLLVLVWVVPKHGLARFATRHPLRQGLRGTMMVTVTLLYFAALKILPLAQATALFFMTPVLVTLFSSLFLRERVGWATWAAVGCGFAGVLIVARPGTELPILGVMLALGGAAGNAVYQTLTRAQASADSPQAQLLYSGLFGAVIMTASLPFWWRPLELDATGWTVFVLLGLLGGVGHLLLIRAYQLAAASRLAPWMYSQLLLSIAIGYLVFGDAPDSVALVGMAVIAVSPQIVRLGERALR
jgi:drug/metabolite transporter (DMT)-like permease